MERVISWLAVVLAVGIAVVAIYELDQREDVMDVAAPTPVVTSPAVEESPPQETVGVATTPPTTPLETPAATTEPPAAAAPTPEPTATPEPTTAPPATSPPVTSPDAIPHTGGGAVGPGLALTAVATALGLASRRRGSG